MKSKDSKINVKLGKNSYDILIGKNIFSNHSSLMQNHFKNKHLIIITDKNVKDLHWNRLKKSFEKFTKKINLISLNPGEISKSLKSYFFICDEILKLNVDRNITIIAFGGGVIGDISGFVASTLLRGVNFVQIPTTLLAQVDSSVGGKTGVNSKYGKNLIGSFYQPTLVLIDISFLISLPPREIKSGYVEILKYSLIYDRNFFEWLEKNYINIFKLNTTEIVYAIKTSCEIKSKFVQEDEKEKNKRALLNLGHTFGHALETETKFGNNLLHGEAVCIGISLALSYSLENGFCSGQDTKRVLNHLDEIGVPNNIKSLSISKFFLKNLISHMKKDKKNTNNNITLILLKEIGKAFIKKNIVEDKINKFLEKQL